MNAINTEDFKKLPVETQHEYLKDYHEFRQNVLKTVEPYFDKAIEFLIDSDLYVNDISSIRDTHRPHLEYINAQNGQALYAHATRTVCVKPEMIPAINAIWNNNLELRFQNSSYYLPSNDEYIYDQKLLAEEYLVHILVHEITHHIQNLRRSSNFDSKWRHVVDKHNLPEFNRNTIKRYECETTYNEIAYLRHVNSDVRINSISEDKRLIESIFTNSEINVHTRAMHGYLWAERVKPEFRINIVNLGHDIQLLIDLANGIVWEQASKRLDPREVFVIKKDKSKRSSSVIYAPDGELVIDTVFWRKIKINRMVEKFARKHNKQTSYIS